MWAVSWIISGDRICVKFKKSIKFASRPQIWTSLLHSRANSVVTHRWVCWRISVGSRNMKYRHSVCAMKLKYGHTECQSYTTVRYSATSLCATHLRCSKPKRVVNIVAVVETLLANVETDIWRYWRRTSHVRFARFASGSQCEMDLTDAGRQPRKQQPWLQGYEFTVRRQPRHDASKVTWIILLHILWHQFKIQTSRKATRGALALDAGTDTTCGASSVNYSGSSKWDAFCTDWRS